MNIASTSSEPSVIVSRTATGLVSPVVAATLPTNLLPLTTPQLHDYRSIGQIFMGQIRSKYPSATFAKKWQNQDLRWPHSDIDVRIFLPEAPASWLDLNRDMYQAQCSLSQQARISWRTLEHPPGFVWLNSELDNGLALPGEIQSWSLMDGDSSPSALKRWQSESNNEPWSDAERGWYEALIFKRRLIQNDAANVYAQPDGFDLHRMCWHLYATAQFSAYAVASRTRPDGKTSALLSDGTFFSKQIIDLVNADYADKASLDRVLSWIWRYLPTVQRVTTAKTNTDIRRLLARSIAGLRARPAHLMLYADPPAGVSIGYLRSQEYSTHKSLHLLHQNKSHLPAKVRPAIDELIEQLDVGVAPTAGRVRYALDALQKSPNPYQTVMSCSL